MDKIVFSTKEQLDIYMNPQRQRLLMILEKSSEAKTPKELSLLMGISASSVQHHIKKLESIGLVFLDHTAEIHGITAKYYSPVRATIQIGSCKNDPYSKEREVILRNVVANVVEDAMTEITQKEKPNADAMTGAVHLSREDAMHLHDIILDFTEKHKVPKEGTEAWEFAVVFCGEEK